MSMERCRIKKIPDRQRAFKFLPSICIQSQFFYSLGSVLDQRLKCLTYIYIIDELYQNICGNTSKSRACQVTQEIAGAVMLSLQYSNSKRKTRKYFNGMFKIVRIVFS